MSTRAMIRRGYNVMLLALLTMGMMGLSATPVGRPPESVPGEPGPGPEPELGGDECIPYDAHGTSMPAPVDMPIERVERQSGAPRLPDSIDATTGSPLESPADESMPSIGPNGIHSRSFNSLLDSTDNANDTSQGWLWRHNMMKEIVSADEGDYTNAALTVILSANRDLEFTNTATDSWTVDDFEDFAIAHDDANDRFVLSADDGREWRFRDFDYATAEQRGLLYEMRDNYGNALTITHVTTSGLVERVDDAGGHRMAYSYVSTNGVQRLKTIRTYKTSTENDANLIGEVEYTYYGTNNTNGGIAGDLQLVTTRKKATADADGTLSIVRQTHYRYWSGVYHAVSNPGTDHKLKFIIRPENFARLIDEEGADAHRTVDDATLADYANAYFEYDSDYRVSTLIEQGGSCGSCGGGGGTGITTFAWDVNTNAISDYNTWALHGVMDRPDDTRVIFDINRARKTLTWVLQDTDDGSPNRERVWHNQFNDRNRVVRAFTPASIGAYDESAPFGVTSNGVGLAHEYTYFGAGAYEDWLESVSLRLNTTGTVHKVIEYGRTEPNRPDLATSITRYEDTAGIEDLTTTFAYTFHNVSSTGVKTVTTTYPQVTAARNGPDVATVEQSYYDDNGLLRWVQDGEGYVTYYGYDDTTGGGEQATGQNNLVVRDVNTQTLPAAVDDDWAGAAPFSRVDVTTTPLNLATSQVIDARGRVRKSTDPEGLITWQVYSDVERRVYPAWDAATAKPLLPAQITRFDRDGRAEDLITLRTTASITTNGSHEPSGGETPAQSDYATWTVNAYDYGGQLTDSKRYHNIPSSTAGARYTNYYQTTRTYDAMGRVAAVFEDVADGSPEAIEQVTAYTYNELGLVTEVQMGVSDDDHDAITSNGLPALVTVSRTFYDDPNTDANAEHGDAGPGNVSWTQQYFGTGGSDHVATFNRYDFRNRRGVSERADGTTSVMLYDNLDRVVTSGTFKSTGPVAGDDPAANTYAANRLSLSKTYFDEVGRVYQTEQYQDVTDSTPADALISNTYYDRRSLVVAGDAANTGATETVYDGAGRRIQVRQATALEATKYSTGAFNYLDDNENIVAVTDYTLDADGKAAKVVHRELNHDDTDGMDLDGSDFIATTVCSYYDAADRMSAAANYGTNTSTWSNGSPVSCPGSAPARSDTILVTSYTYDSAGRRTLVTDPKAIDTHTQYDDLGRSVAKTEDSGGLERKTEYQYNAQGSLVRIIADLDADNTFAGGVWTMAGGDVDQVTEYAYTDGVNARWVTETRFPTGDGTVGSASTDKLVFSYHVDGTLATRVDQNGTELTYDYDDARRKVSEVITDLGSGVAGEVMAVTWKYNDAKRLEFITTHDDDSPDTASWTDAVNQIKNTYDTAGYLLKQEQEVDGAVDGSTLAVEMAYETDFTASGAYKRLKYLEYPDGTRLFSGYTHSGGGGTFQDTINAAFSRVGQLAFADTNGSPTIGDLLVEYDYNGMHRFVRRAHDDAAGSAGNDTRLDLWHGSSGTYAGLDRFGRAIDLKFTDYNASPVEFDRRKYTHDRNGNPTGIENTVFKGRSQVFGYDDLNRLVSQDEGILVGGSIALSELERSYNMDLLGNLVASAGGFKQNSGSSTFTHAVNATNELTTITRGNPAGRSRLVLDDFASSLSAIWSQEVGDWSISGGKVNVDDLGSPIPAFMGRLMGSAVADDGSLEVKTTLPSGGGTAGLIFSKAGSNFWGVSVTNGSSNNIQLFYFSGAGAGTSKASTSATISVSTEYTIRVVRIQRHVDITIFDGASVIATLAYDSPTDFGDGTFGMWSTAVDAQFDDFSFTRLDQVHAPAAPRFASTAQTALNTGSAYLQVESFEYGGESRLEWAGDTEYIAQADIDLNSGDWAELRFRHADPDNYYAVRIGPTISHNSGPVELIETVRGKRTVVGSQLYTTSSPPFSVKVKITSGDAASVWVEGTLEFNAVGMSGVPAGGVALASEKARFSALKVGYDNNADDDIDDGGDDLVVSNPFGSTAITPTHDDNGNLTFDGTYKYTYDAWNRLVKATLEDTDVVIQQAEFDGLGRRIRKVVTNSGDLDGVTVYLYNGHQIIETRDGSGNVETQVYHGTRYIDEVVGLRVKDQGRVYLHQDANWNVTAMTDLTGRIIERYWYSPYGELEAIVAAHPFDYDDDGDVDDDDYAVTTNGTCSGAASGDCRRLDANADGVVNGDDRTVIAAYIATLDGDTALQRVPISTYSRRGNYFGHQGLVLDAELASYQNRARQYAPKAKRFVQRDPLIANAKAGSGYQDGASMYSFCRSNSQIHLDPSGKSIIVPCMSGKTTFSCIYKSSTQSGGGCLIVTVGAIKDKLQEGCPETITWDSCSSFGNRKCNNQCAYTTCLTIPNLTKTATVLGGTCTVTITFDLKTCGTIRFGWKCQ